MKGLLIKDLKLMKIQRNFFLMIFAISIGLIIFSGEYSFVLGFTSFTVSLFTLSTISYDELDNGNAFLFTLPITRKSYVIEKYSLGALSSLVTLLFTSLLIAILSFFKGSVNFIDIFQTVLFLFPVILLSQALLIPSQLKFGAEKGRIVMVAGFALLFIIALVTSKILMLLNIDLSVILIYLFNLNIGAILVISLAISIILIFISMKISISIMNKKEF